MVIDRIWVGLYRTCFQLIVTWASIFILIFISYGHLSTHIIYSLSIFLININGTILLLNYKINTLWLLFLKSLSMHFYTYINTYFYRNKTDWILECIYLHPYYLSTPCMFLSYLSWRFFSEYPVNRSNYHSCKAYFK